MRKGLALVLAILFVGCNDDKPKQSTDEVANAEDIYNAQTEAFNKTDPLLIKQGQYVYTIVTQELYSSQEPIENMTSERSVNVIQREEFGDHFDITTIDEAIDYTFADKPHFKIKNVYSIEYPVTSVAAFASQTTEKLLLKKLDGKVLPFDDAGDDEGPSYSYYNFKISHEKVDPPKKVMETSPCAEGADCRINVTKMAYDVVITEPGVEAQRRHFDLWVSPDVPYFASVLKSCMTTMVQIDTSFPLLRLCDTVYDYRFEAPPAP
jgi:hypothetical protein